MNEQCGGSTTAKSEKLANGDEHQVLGVYHAFLRAKPQKKGLMVGK